MKELQKDLPQNSSNENSVNEITVKYKKPLLPAIETGKVLGDSINSTYTQIYAVFINSSPFLISIMTSVRNLLRLTTQSLFGNHSDSFGRKPYIVCGLFLAAIMSFIIPMIEDPILLLMAIIVYSLAFSIFTPAWIAYIGDISISGSRGSFFGRITSIGVLITFIILVIMGWGIPLLTKDNLMQYFIIYRIGAVAFSVAGFFALFIKETIHNDSSQNNKVKQEKTSLFQSIEDKMRQLVLPLKENATFRRFVIINAFMDFSMSLGWPIFGFIRERYATPSENSFLWAVFMGCQVISLTLGGRIVDRYGKTIGFWGRRFMFLIPIVLFFSRNWYQLALGNLVGGLGYGLYFVAMNAYIIESAPEQAKGNYIGAYQLIMGIVTFIGSISMGILTDFLIHILGKWDTIYLMLIIVIIFRFIGGLIFFLVKEPIKTEKNHYKDNRGKYL